VGAPNFRIITRSLCGLQNRARRGERDRIDRVSVRPVGGNNSKKVELKKGKGELSRRCRAGEGRGQNPVVHYICVHETNRKGEITFHSCRPVLRRRTTAVRSHFLREAKDTSHRDKRGDGLKHAGELGV